MEPTRRPRRTRGRLLVVLVVLVLVAACAAIAWLVLVARPRLGGDARGTGPSALEAWATARLETFLDDMLEPRLSIGVGRYEPPRTFWFDDVALEHEGVRFLSVGRLRIELREVPTGSGPMRIAGLRLERPQVVLVPREDGTLLGFDDLVEQDATTPEARAKLSDVLRFERIEIVEGRIVHRARGGRETVLDAIGLDLAATPDPKAPSAFELSGRLGRSEIFEAAMRGSIDLDRLAAELSLLDLKIDVGDEPAESIPSSLRELFDRSGLRGRFEVLLAGRMPIGDPLAGVASMRVTIADAYAALPDRRIELDDVELDAHLADRRLVIEDLDVLACGGRGSAVGELVPDDDWLLHLDLSIDGMRFEDFLDAVSGIDSTTRGVMRLDGAVDFSLVDFVATSKGRGRIAIEQGVLSVSPTFEALGRAVGAVVRRGSTASDRGEAGLVLEPGGLRLNDLRILAPGMATRGSGRLGFDGALDFRVNAGPLERLQEATGPLGSFFAGITDRLGTYLITGSTDKPKVTYRPFGI